MTHCIDEVWELFQKHVSDPDVRLAFARDLIVDSEYENLGTNPFCALLMEFLAEHDDEYFLEFCCIDDDSTIEEVIEDLKFQMDENDLSVERRDRLMALWMKQTGKFDPESRRQFFLKEKEILEKRIQDINDNLQDLTGS